MTCRECEIILSSQLEGEATASQWREAERHLAECSTCAMLWQDFRTSASLFKTKLERYEPSEMLWEGIAARIKTGLPGSRIETFREKWQRWTAVAWPGGPRLAIGFGVALVLMALLTIPLLRHRAAAPLPQTQRTDSTAVVLLEPKSQRPRVARKENDPLLRARLVQEVSDYFEATRLVLLEVKNNAEAPQEFDAAQIKQSSQKLLEQSLLLKAELQGEKSVLLRNTIEQLEVMLFDLANLEDKPEREEIETLRAAIQQGDLLVKIEIIDLEAFRRKKAEPLISPPRRRSRPRI